MDFETPQGSTFTLIVDAMGADMTGTTCAGDVKAYAGGVPKGAVLASFAAAYSPDIEGEGPGWYMELSKATTAQLVPGDYVTDFLVTKDGLGTKTKRLTFKITAGVTFR